MENEETHKETQGQANHEAREASAPGFAAPTEENHPIPLTVLHTP